MDDRTQGEGGQPWSMSPELRAMWRAGPVTLAAIVEALTSAARRSDDDAVADAATRLGLYVGGRTARLAALEAVAEAAEAYTDEGGGMSACEREDGRMRLDAALARLRALDAGVDDPARPVAVYVAGADGKLADVTGTDAAAWADAAQGEDRDG